MDIQIETPQSREALTECVQFYDQVYTYRDARWPATAEFEVPVLTGESPFAQGRILRPLLARSGSHILASAVAVVDECYNCCPPSRGGQEMVLVRGVTPMGFLVHDKLRFVVSRAPRPAVREAAVGMVASQRYQGLGLGDTLSFGDRVWTVVRLFTADGSAFESEVWLDVGELFKDGAAAGCSGVRFVVASGTDRDALIRRIAEDPRISFAAKSELAYYEEQAEGAKTLYLLALILAVIMGTGAVFGAMNTMFAAVAHRTAEIGTRTAPGFSRWSILTSFVSEAGYLALLGYLLGVALGVSAVALVNRLMQGVAFQLPSFSTAVVTLRWSPPILVVALGLAVVMGILRGLLPARRAARLRVTEALRRA